MFISASNPDLEQYCDLFLNHHVTGRVLLNLTQEDLANIGITALGHKYELSVSIEITLECLVIKPLQHSPGLYSPTI